MHSVDMGKTTTAKTAKMAVVNGHDMAKKLSERLYAAAERAGFADDLRYASAWVFYAPSAYTPSPFHLEVDYEVEADTDDPADMINRDAVERAEKWLAKAVAALSWPKAA